MTDLTQIKEIRDICTQICDIYRNKMDQAGYDKNGELYNFKEIVEYKNNLFEIAFDLPQYFHFAENGRRPGKMPPVNKILQWIEFKHLVPRSNNGRVPTTRQLAFAISKHIAKYGTQGKHLLQQTIDSTYDTLVDRLVEAIADKIENELEKDIEEI